jgi:hypothetical protein
MRTMRHAFCRALCRALCQELCASQLALSGRQCLAVAEHCSRMGMLVCDHVMGYGTSFACVHCCLVSRTWHGMLCFINREHLRAHMVKRFPVMRHVI